MSCVFEVDGPQGVITNVSNNAESNAFVSETIVFNNLYRSNELNSIEENGGVVVKNDVAQSELDFTNLFHEFFEEQPPLPPPRDYRETALFIAGPVHLDQSFDDGFFLAPEQEPLCRYEYYPFDPQEFEPVMRKGRGRPAGVKNKEKEVVEKQKRIRVVDVNKTVFTYPQIIAMTLINVKDEIATAQMFYAFAEHHFPDMSAISSWKNSLRHVLADNKNFERVQNVTNLSVGKGQFWTFISGRRDELIEQIYKTMNENKGSMEKLRMRNIADLPLILNGNCPLPAKVMTFAITSTKKAKPQVFREVTIFEYNVPQQFLAPNVPADVPNYSNQNVPAHQESQWNPFEQQGYMQANQENQMVNSENKPCVQQSVDQYEVFQNIPNIPHYY